MRASKASQAQERALARSRIRRFGRGAALVAALLVTVLPVFLLADPISYAPLIMVVIVCVCSFVALQLSARSLKVDESALVKSCERGSAVPLHVSFDNRSWAPVARVEAVFFITDIAGGYDATTSVDLALAPRERMELVFNATFAHLGRYSAGIDYVVLHDFIGLFQKRIDIPYHDSIDVRPRLFDPGDIDISNVTNEESANAARPVVADDLDYSGVREYRYGDPLKTVHWNLSGRDPEGKLYTRLYEVYAEPGLAVIVDPYTPDYGTEDLMGAFDGLVESAASVSQLAREMGIDAEVRFLAADGTPSSAHLGSAKDIDALVHAMMMATPASSAPDSQAAVELLLREANAPQGRGNVAFCTTRMQNEVVGALVRMGLHRRNPMLFMALPRNLEGREREEALGLLPQLSQAHVPFYLIETTEVRTEVKVK